MFAPTVVFYFNKKRKQQNETLKDFKFEPLENQMVFIVHSEWINLYYMLLRTKCHSLIYKKTYFYSFVEWMIYFKLLIINFLKKLNNLVAFMTVYLRSF